MSGRIEVGGQAVIEGVMMRSPRSFAVVCRRPSGEIVIREDRWEPLWAGLRFLRWPGFRGAVVLLESLWNGMSALSFSADQQALAEEAKGPAPRSLGARAAEEGPLSPAAKTMMLVVSLAFGLGLFVGVPHLLAWGLGHLLGFDVQSGLFHLVDGVIKTLILLGYLSLISLLPDIRRVFQYHGAEHKAIFTYEKGEPLTVENARRNTRFHPRCGTSFLLIVIMVSVVVFSAALRGQLSPTPLVDHALKIGLKLPLMFPVAGLAYELIKLAGRYHETSGLARALSRPGLWLQRITTREPTDDQLEIALVSIRKTLWRERNPTAVAPEGHVQVYASAAALDLPLT